jgi:hypothetical protein
MSVRFGGEMEGKGLVMVIRMGCLVKEKKKVASDNVMNARNEKEGRAEDNKNDKYERSLEQAPYYPLSLRFNSR